MARFNVTTYGAVGDGSTDSTPAFISTYAAAYAGSPAGEMFIPAGAYKVTSRLLWNLPVNVTGDENIETTVIRKSGNFDAIHIEADGSAMTYRGFVVTSLDDSSINSGDTGHGIKMVSGNNVCMERVTVRRQGGHGFYLPGTSSYCMNGKYFACYAMNNGGSGFRLDGVSNTNRFYGVTANANAVGFDINSSGDTCNGNVVDATCESNTGAGLHIGSGAIQNVINVYLEDNDDEALVLDSGSERNWITVTNLEAAPTGKVLDNGTNNYVNAVGWGNYVSYPFFKRIAPGTNIAGRNMNIAAGDAGAGSTGRAGGELTLRGGAAVGTSGGADGGAVHLEGGAGVNGNSAGVLYLQENNNQVTVFGDSSASADPTSVSIDFASVTRVPLLPRLTSTQIASLTAVNGMIVYNINTSTVQARTGGTWTSL